MKTLSFFLLVVIIGASVGFLAGVLFTEDETNRCIPGDHGAKYAQLMGEAGLSESYQVNWLERNGFVPVLGVGWVCPLNEGM